MIISLSAEQEKRAIANRRRIAGEKRVVRQAVKDLIAAGYTITVFDGEEYTVEKSTDTAKVIGALFTVDIDYLYVSKPGCKNSFVMLVYGNAPGEVISDYGVSLEDVLQPAFKLGDEIDARI